MNVSHCGNAANETASLLFNVKNVLANISNLWMQHQLLYFASSSWLDQELLIQSHSHKMRFLCDRGYLDRLNHNNVFPLSSDSFKCTRITWRSHYIIMDLHANYITVRQHAVVDGQWWITQLKPCSSMPMAPRPENLYEIRGQRLWGTIKTAMMHCDEIRIGSDLVAKTCKHTCQSYQKACRQIQWCHHKHLVKSCGGHMWRNISHFVLAECHNTH